MASIYVSLETLREAADYFSQNEEYYTSPEQIGLFFLFKGMKYDSHTYHPFPRNPEDRDKYTRVLHNLAGLFDPRTEKGGKRTGLFPFSITPGIRASTYYNGGTEFRGLYNRVKDTMDNTLVDENKYLKKDDLNPDTFKFPPDYIQLLSEKFLNGHRISLKYFAAWYTRFFKFSATDEMAANITAEHCEDFARVCVKRLREELNLTSEELAELFDTEEGEIRYQTSPVTGDELRELLTYDGDEAKPDVSVATRETDLMNYAPAIEEDEFNKLMAPHGNNITDDGLETLLLSTKQVVLAGPPGTGKSYISKQIRSHFDESFLIQFHPNLTYEQFIGGTSFAEDGTVQAKAGVFLEFCEKARQTPGQKFLFLIDEINRGNVSKVFGETILTLDREYAAMFPLPLKASDGQQITEFSIPANVYILATMNSADRSIALVDYAIRRRFAFVNFYPNSEVVDYRSDYSALPAIKVGALMNAINEKLYSVLGDADLLLGQSYFMPKWAFDDATGKLHWTPEILQNLMNYYVLPIIEEYTYGNRRYLTNILGDKLPDRIVDTDAFLEELKTQFSL